MQLLQHDPAKVTHLVCRAVALILLIAFTGCGEETTPSPESVLTPEQLASRVLPGGPTMMPGTATPGASVPEAGTDPAQIPSASAPPGAAGLNSPFITPGVREPKMYGADEIAVPEDAKLIGVVIDGHAHAYLLEAMTPMNSHIVNEVVAEKPVSVTYCSLSDCVRVFSKAGTTEPLDLAVGGYRNEQMMLRLDGQMYDHTAETIPLEDVDFVRTEWLAWKLEHPDTKIYVGLLADKFVLPAKPDSGS